LLPALLMAALVDPLVALADEPYRVIYEHDVAVRLRDGVTLRADIYRPDSADAFPVLLERTPYDKRESVDFGLKAAARGYVAIIEDVRGRYASEGEWYPFRNESADGYDTIEWAAALPYANGKVGMVGGSYVGATQLLAAITHPPHLAGICPDITGSNYHENWTYRGGAFELWFGESWTAGLVQDTYHRRVKKLPAPVEGVANLPLVDYPVLGNGPVAGSKVLTSTIAPYFLDWLAHPDYDDYWRPLSIEARYADITVPALHLAAWYDIFLDGSLRNYVGIKAGGGSEAARRGQQLLVYVGGHAGSSELSKVGAVDFGPRAPFDIEEVILSWYDGLLKGKASDEQHGKPVSIFVMGVNEWRDEESWPLARARSTRYHLHSRHNAGGTPNDAGSAGAGGVLSMSAPWAEEPDRYQYNPQQAVPTIGGPLCCGPLPTGIGPQDQRPNEARSDVLVYTTKAFTTATEFTGPVSLDLYVSSSAPDTDFTGMLIDVWPNGVAQNLTDGIQRLRYRESSERAVAAVPGEIYRLRINLSATSNVFLPGHRLRLEISSSNFPRFDRNLNTGDLQSRATRMEIASNVIYHDRQHPSALILPLVN
jgi:uncharacterized protein